MDANKSEALWMQGTRRNTRSSANYDKENKEKTGSGTSDEGKKDKGDSKKVNGHTGHILRGPQNEVVAFETDDGITYNRFDSAYIATERHDNPYFIAIIQEIKVSKKDHAVIVVKWYYRPGEVPDSVYQMLVKERLDGAEDQKEKELILNVETRNRELFAADDDMTESFPVSRLRGKCSVKYFNDFHEVKDYDLKADTFFYILGYNPETRRLTSTKGEVRVGPSHQWTASTRGMFQKANIPDLLPPFPPSKEQVNHEYEELVWAPKVNDCDLLMYLYSARSMAAFAGLCDGGSVDEGCMVAARDETTMNAFNVLFENNGNPRAALQALVKKPPPLTIEKKWTEDQVKRFQKGLRQNGKNFFKIRKELLPNKDTSELVEFYYLWKKVQENLMVQPQSKSRRQASALSKRGDKQVQPSFEAGADASSSETESESEESDKDVTGFRCKHCCTTKSEDWNVGGKEGVMLCTKCRIIFKKYGEDTQVDIDFDHDTPSDVDDVDRGEGLLPTIYEKPKSDARHTLFMFKPIKEGISDAQQKPVPDNGAETPDIKPGCKREWEGDGAMTSDQKKSGEKRIKTEADLVESADASTPSADDRFQQKRHDPLQAYPKQVVPPEKAAAPVVGDIIRSDVGEGVPAQCQAPQHGRSETLGLSSPGKLVGKNSAPDVPSPNGGLGKPEIRPTSIKSVDPATLHPHSFFQPALPAPFRAVYAPRSMPSSVVMSYPVGTSSNVCSKTETSGGSVRKTPLPAEAPDTGCTEKHSDARAQPGTNALRPAVTTSTPQTRPSVDRPSTVMVKSEPGRSQGSGGRPEQAPGNDASHPRVSVAPYAAASTTPSQPPVGTSSSATGPTRPTEPGPPPPQHPNPAGRLSTSERPASQPAPALDKDELNDEPAPVIPAGCHMTVPAGKPLPDNFKLYDDGLLPRSRHQQRVCYTHSRLRFSGYPDQLCSRTDLAWIPGPEDRKGPKKEQKQNVAQSSGGRPSSAQNSVHPAAEKQVVKQKPKEEKNVASESPSAAVKPEPRLVHPMPRSASAHPGHQRSASVHAPTFDANRPPPPRTSPYEVPDAAAQRLRQYASTVDSQRALLAAPGHPPFALPHTTMQQSERDLRERELRERELRERMPKHGFDAKLLEGLDPAQAQALALQASWPNIPPGMVPGMPFDPTRPHLQVLGAVPGASPQIPAFHPQMIPQLDFHLQQQAQERIASERLRVAQSAAALEMLHNHQHSHVHSHLHLHPSNNPHPGLIPPALASASVNDPAVNPYVAMALQAQSQQAAMAGMGLDPLHPAASMANPVLNFGAIRAPSAVVPPPGLPILHPNIPARPETLQHYLTASQHLQAVAHEQSLVESRLLQEEYMRLAFGHKP